MGLKENIKYYRKAKGLTQAEVADKLNVARATVTQWETGDTSPKVERLEKLAEIFEIAPGMLISYEMDEPGGTPADAMEYLKLKHEVNQPTGIGAIPSTRTVPVIGRIAAGDPREAIQDTGERWYVPDPLLDGHPGAFYLIVGGDSMDRIIPEGSLVLIDPDVEVHSGEVAAVLVNGCDATLKRVYFAGDTIVLHPESHNSEHHDQTIDKTDPDAPLFRVVGKAITYTAPEGWRA